MRSILFLFLILGIVACEQKVAEEAEKKENAALQTEVAADPFTVINDQIRADINNPALYVERALLYSKANDHKAAMGDIKRAVGLDSNRAATYLALSDIYANVGLINYVESTIYQAIKVEPENPEVYVKLSEWLLFLKKYDESIEAVDKALRLNKYLAKGYYIKGFNFMLKGDTSLAISSYQTATEQDPDYLDAYMQLGTIMIMQDNPLAIDYLKTAITIDSTHIPAYYNFGLYAQEHEMYNEAIEAYIKITKIDPNYRDAYYNLGYVHMYYLKLYREATRYFTRAVEADPNYYQAYYNRGYSFELLGDILNAEKDYKKSLFIKPDYTLPAKGLQRIDEIP